ncbi:probable inactive histone-lysine N-methyltransferase SUVR2 [Cornus florida]|uniref:probable inactive histone-lysine N-methyltransferase SUVR2 n=1 Tax=Cornus florida TaxID=4283 RepID=UPI0028979BA2|nr:probable inactive histone-lysine N-methyltransferase SUVR2 [Cornus florida]
MAPNPKVAKAFSAMNDLGISAETVKPVLKNLLRLYDKRWELIEEDNYRTLADAIFESGDDKQREYERKDVMVHHGSEPPFKKLHVAQQEDQVSSTVDNANTMLDLDEDNISQTSILPKLQELSQSCLKDQRSISSSHLLQPPINDKGKDPISSHFVPSNRKSSFDRASSTFLSNPAMDGLGYDHIRKEKMPKDNRPHFAVPTSMIHSGSLEGSSTVVDSVKYFMTQNADNGNKVDGTAANYGTDSEGSFDIASSPFGEVKVKLYLDCNSALGQPNFHCPNFDAVVKYVENKYLRSYKIVGPQFSVMKLLKELCESYLELGTDSADRFLVKRSGDCDGRIREHSREILRTGSLGRELNKKELSFSGSSSSRSLVIAEQQPTAHGKKRSFRRISDMAKGMEKVKISLIDEIGNEHVPNFIYIPQNTIYQNAYIHFSLARIADEDCCSDCSGDCLSFSVPCACARDTGGEFAYTPQGLLKEEFLTACISMNQEPQKHYNFYCEDCPLERAKNGYRPEPCKGHLVRKFIKECWRKCGCNLQCGNRVVQRGIACNLQVFLTNDGKGWGLRTLEELPKGAFVCEYVGEILTNMELYERNNQSSGNLRHTYPVLLDADWGSEGVLKDEDALCLDATYYGNVARFINHRCFDGNLLEIPVEVETPDHHYYHLAFFTKRKVDALEELTWDYGIDFDDHNHPIKAFQCCCGSAFCRSRKKWN